MYSSSVRPCAGRWRQVLERVASSVGFLKVLESYAVVILLMTMTTVNRDVAWHVPCGHVASTGDNECISVSARAPAGRCAQ